MSDDECGQIYTHAQGMRQATEMLGKFAVTARPLDDNLVPMLAIEWDKSVKHHVKEVPSFMSVAGFEAPAEDARAAYSVFITAVNAADWFKADVDIKREEWIDTMSVKELKIAALRSGLTLHDIHGIEMPDLVQRVRASAAMRRAERGKGTPRRGDGDTVPKRRRR